MKAIQVEKLPPILASFRKKLGFVLGPLFLFLLFCSLHQELQKQWVWQQNSPELRQLGQHFIVGLRDFHEIAKLARQGAIGGVYWSRAQFQKKSLAQIKKEIQALQKIRQQAGLPALVMALDEEGGIVSALQERLGPQPGLAQYAEAHGDEAKIHSQIRSFSIKKAQLLKDLGFTVNFSPVVDLKFTQDKNFFDTHSFISERSPGRDPGRVTQRALEYSQALLQNGITPTLKHFPGLGRVAADTHFNSGALLENLATLEQSDFVPFRSILSQIPAWTMLSHTKLMALDSEDPVSISQKVVHDLIRQDWQHDGILVTDDFSMGPIVGGKGGVKRAAVEALNVGVDYILISKNPQLFYPAIAALLEAQKRGQLQESTLVKSSQRIDFWQQQQEEIAFHETSSWKHFTQNLVRHFPQDPAVAARRLSATLGGNTSLPVALQP